MRWGQELKNVFGVSGEGQSLRQKRFEMMMAIYGNEMIKETY